MKKNQCLKWKWLFKWRSFFHVLGLTMVLSLGSFSGYGARNVQDTISLDLKEVKLEKFVEVMKEKTGLNFLYNSSLFKGMEPISVVAKGEPWETVLRGVLDKVGFMYDVKDEIVVIKRVPTEDKNGQEKRSRMIKGRVTDANKEPLPGVTVLFKGTTVGTATNTNGEFSLNVVEGIDTLVVTFVGMKTQYLRLVEGKTEYRIQMQEDVETLEDVVVTGYGNVSKGNYTGASTNVKVAEVMMAGVSSIDQMLQGVVPGMLVRNTSGQVGATSKIRVRGTSTLLGSQEPVWVVDGVVQRDPQPFNSDDNTKFTMDADDIRQLAGNAISWLNPYDIETITVLKDASATAIYGSKAANGVIVITTKKAKQGQLAVNYNGSFSIGQRPRYGLYDRMNSAEHMQFSKDIYGEHRKYTSRILPIGYAGLVQKLTNKEITVEEMDKEYQKMARQNTDWFKLLFRNSFNHSHAISISGGSEKLMNRTSFSFTEEKGEAKGNEVTSFTATSNTTAIFGESLIANLLLKGTIREVDGFAYGVDPFNYAYNTTRVIPAYNEDGSLYYHGKRGTASYAMPNKDVYDYNIMNELDNTGSSNSTRTWGTTIDLKWKLLPGLEYQGLFSYTSSSANSKKYASERSFYITQMRGYEFGTVQANSTEMKSSPLPFGGLLEMDLVNTTTITVRNSLVYDRLFQDKHRLTLQLGIETNSVKTKGETTKRYGYLPERGETFAVPPATYLNGNRTMDNMTIATGSASVINRLENELSEYASAIYTYDNRYVVNLNARLDASNRFSQDKNKRVEPTWSAGVKWRVKQEVFAGDWWWLNNLDLYGSYGYQGNAVPSVSPYLIASTGTLNHLYQSYIMEVKSLPYPELGWEKTKTYNFGVDASLLKGRLNFTFNYFDKKSYVLASRNVPYENGMGNSVVSGSNMKNYGYDFVVEVVPVQTKDFSWHLSLNTSVTRNKVEKNQRVNQLSDYLNGTSIVNGRPFSTFYSYEFDKLDSEDGRPLFKNMDIEGADSALDFLVESGKFTPDFSGGLNTMFKYKSWSLYALFAVQWGGHGRLPELYPGASVQVNGLPMPEQNVSRKLINRWKTQGDEARTSIPSLPGLGNEKIDIPVTTESTSTLENLYHLYNLSDQLVANTDFIRCRSLSLAYELNPQWLKRLYIQRMQVKASMTNPFIWVFDKKWDGLDPETGNWPARRITSLSIQIAF